MKKTFDLIQISPTQWVLVDKTRGPLINEPYINIDHPEYGVIENVFGSKTERLKSGELAIVLAAYPKIEGIDLIPERVWEKQANWRKAFKNTSLERQATLNMSDNFVSGFQAGYEAAGGYTREQMIEFYDMIRKWSSVEIHNKSSQAAVDLFISTQMASPRSLVIEVGEDGSLPSENGTIIYTEVIY